MEPYKDTSIFQGIVQYHDDDGVEWRREDSQHTHHFYMEHGHAFIHQGVLMRSMRQNSIRYIHQKFLSQQTE